MVYQWFGLKTTRMVC
jgi:hypothetical protein